MHVIIGQDDTDGNELRLRHVMAEIEKDGIGVGIQGCKAWRDSLAPLRWSVAFSVPEQPIEEWLPDESRGQQILQMVGRIGKFLGRGRYYFRVTETKLNDFWDSSYESILSKDDGFNGLPLSIIIGQSNVVEIYRDWNNAYVRQHYSDLIVPFESIVATKDKIRNLHIGVIRILAFKGNWQFMFSVRQTASIKQRCIAS